MCPDTVAFVLLTFRRFVEEIFQVCGETIENEMDPNSFAPFLGLESSEVEGIAAPHCCRGLDNKEHPTEQARVESRSTVEET